MIAMAIDAIDRVPRLGNTAAAAREALLNQQIAARNYAFHEGIDPEDLRAWAWPY
jgi:xylulose-5-phosphate/fructose-6-phosphate phosphoketolase